MTPSYHFFISRAGEDRDIAKEIAGILQSAGHTITLQDDDFLPGQSFPHQMRLAMERADHFIAVISPRYIEKEFTLNELYSAFVEDPIGKKRRLIPVRVVACDLPHPIKHFIYVDFVGQDEAHRKQVLLDTLAPPRGTPQSDEVRTFIRKLPTVDPHLFGRDAQLAWLEQAWLDPRANFVQIIAPGGAGKTALMTRWYRRHLDDVTVFGWSFYSQGTGETSQASSDPFFAEALTWFGITVPATESIFSKVDKLVAHLRRERVLLILDGIEPLQDPGGDLRDLPLKALIQELAARNAGLVLATTRVRLTDVPDDAPSVFSLDLENLDPADGARYLAHLGVRGTEDELRAASEAYDNHALALTLLGTYLVTFCDSDIRRRTDIRELQVDETKPGRHAHKVMASYARMYEDQPELDILHALGYFNRPAEPEALKLVLPTMDARKYKVALKRLHDARLILTTDPAQPLDCHPLIREHFAATATQEGHARLYVHYTTQAPYRPETIEEMIPLFYAVYHGCEAGQHQMALRDVYLERIHRGDEAYLLHSLAAFGTDLSLLANFFESPWTQPVATLSPLRQAWMMNQAGFCLRAVGRLADAVAPMRSAADSDVRLANWENAAICYTNVSELDVTLGNLAAAVAAARQSVRFADRSRDEYLRMTTRTTFADAFHQSGDLTEAQHLFEEAERIEAELHPEYPLLDSFYGYRYCDLFLGQGQSAEVLRRASSSLSWVRGRQWPLDIGLDHLSLGRAHPPGSAEAMQHLEQAVDFLRRAGTLHMLPLALLARGTPQDLAEVFRIATRCGMRLHLTDYHLASARLALRATDRPKALDHFTKAEALIQATGYHRRDPDLAELRPQCT